MPTVATAMIAAAAGSLALSASDVPPRVPVDPGPAPWERPFSLVAGGGTTPATAGVVAGDADLGTVWGGARDGAGRVVVDTTSSLWLVGGDGRLRTIRGVAQDATQYTPTAMRTLPDGRVAIVDRLGRRVVALAPGSRVVTPLATVALAPEEVVLDGAGRPVVAAVDTTPEALGLDRDGRLVAVAGDRVLRLHGTALVPDGAPLVGRVPLQGLGSARSPAACSRRRSSGT